MSKKAFQEALDFHIKESIEDGDKLPGYIMNNNYELDFKLGGFCHAASVRRAHQPFSDQQGYRH